MKMTEIKDLEKNWKEASRLNDDERMKSIEKDLIPRYVEAGINPDNRFNEMFMES